MAKERNEPNTKVQTDSAVTPQATRDKRPSAKPDVKAQTQEAKDLRSLVTMMKQKNSPETSKDITAYAKETLKLVAKSQKSESAAFRREAAKTLVEFRNFVEQTSKVTELRRSQLLSQIDNASLDAKNATMVMLSVAKTQAKNIRLSAAREAAARKAEADQHQREKLKEAQEQAKALTNEAKAKSKLFVDEQTAKIKLVTEERKVKLKAWEEDRKQKQAEKEQKFKEQKETHSQNIAKQKDDLATSKSKSRNHYKQVQDQLKQAHEQRKQELTAERTKLKAEVDQEKLDLRQKRADAAAKIKKLKSDLRDDYQAKMAKGKAELAQRKADQQALTKKRMQDLRQAATDHRIKLKKIEQEASQEAMMKKRAFNKMMAQQDEREKSLQKHRSELGNKVKEGVFEANPLLHAAVEIGMGMGLHDMAAKYMENRKAKKETAKLNKLNHQQAHAAAASGTSRGGATGGAPAAAPAASSGGGAGLFGGLLGMLPDVSSIIGGIGNLFSGIVSGFGKLIPMLARGAVAFGPAIAGVAAVVYGIWKFIEGFNDATSLFGEEISDTDYVRKIYSGFTNVISSILGLFDTVAGWLGFDTDLAGGFRKGAVKVFNAILDTFKSIAGGLAKVLEYIPGMGGVAKTLEEFSESRSPGEFQPGDATPGGALNAKTSAVNDLKDQVDLQKSKGAAVQVVQDNSVKQNSTTIVQGKLDTRNSDVPKYLGNTAMLF